jgi:phospholipase/lecithinase/hemolysin
MLGTNDRNAGRTEAEYINAMRTLANQVKTAGGDVIFLREPTPTEQNFTDGLYGLADEIGAGLIEVGPDWPSTYANAKAEPYGYIGADSSHPSARGHTAIGRTVANALLAAL